MAVRLTILHERHFVATNTASSGAVSDVVSFVSGLLLDNNSDVRNWFSQYIRSGLKACISDAVTVFCSSGIMSSIFSIFV